MTRDEFIGILGPWQTLAGTQVPAYCIPGEPMTADEVVTYMITMGHTQADAEGAIRYVQRAPLPRQRPHVQDWHCHTLKWHRFDGGHYTIIGR